MLPITTLMRGLRSPFFLIVLTSIVVISKAYGGAVDTSIFYYTSNAVGENVRVGTLDSADFIRMITQPDSGSNFYNVKEFYKSGRLRLVGQCQPYIIQKNMPTPIKFEGNCIFYYPNGKRKSIINYVDGYQDGLDHEYFPDGKLYCIFKFTHTFPNYPECFFIDCYDKSGNMICKDGQGKWITYAPGFNSIAIQGGIVNTCREGEWHGSTTLFSDTIKYVYNFKKNACVSSFGYDKAGIVHPFNAGQEQMIPDYEHSMIDFIRLFRAHLKVPRDTSGNKISIDTVRISFIVEENGHLTTFKTVGKTDPNLAKALNDAFVRSPSVWFTRTFFGIPLRSLMTIPIKETSGYIGEMYSRRICYKEIILVP